MYSLYRALKICPPHNYPPPPVEKNGPLLLLAFDHRPPLPSQNSLWCPSILHPPHYYTASWEEEGASFLSPSVFRGGEDGGLGGGNHPGGKRGGGGGGIRDREEEERPPVERKRGAWGRKNVAQLAQIAEWVIKKRSRETWELNVIHLLASNFMSFGTGKIREKFFILHSLFGPCAKKATICLRLPCLLCTR